MKKDDIKRAFEAVEPSAEQKQRMLDGVLYHFDNKRKSDFMKFLKPKRIIASFIMVIFVVGCIISYNYFIDIPSENTAAEGGDRTNGDEFIGGNTNTNTEDCIAPITNQFKIDDKTYILLSDEYKANVNFPLTITADDLGEKITTINSSVDASLKGRDVYDYKPAGSQAIVAVKKGDEYKLFKFLAFDSYNNNQDEDAAVYLELYGIKSASDIAKIQFIGHSEQAKLSGTMDLKAEITDKADITKFYDFYSIIKNSSDKYFEKLYNYRSQNVNTDEVPPDYIAEGGTDEPVKSSNSTGKIEYAQDTVIGAQTADIPQRLPYPTKDIGQTAPSSGSGAANMLSDSVTMRIYNQSGVYFEAEYYMKFGFISRHEVNSEFSSFLANYIK